MKGWTPNEKAAALAVASGVLLLVSGLTGASQWSRTFELLADLFGPSAVLHVAAAVFIAIGSVGGVLVLMGALAFRRNRVRLGKLLILLGTGFTIVTLLVLLLVIALRHRDVPFAAGVVLGIAGVVLSIAARLQARARPLKW